MKIHHNIDLLVISCDSYSDVWQIFFNNFFMNWSECPLDIHLLTNFKKIKDKKINCINVGPDISWSDNLLKGLKKIEKDYVFLMIDDLLVNKRISNKYFDKLSKWINSNSPNYVRLHIANKPNFHDKTLGKIPNKTIYKTSTMPCIWKISTLKKLLKKGESAWDFEINGSLRAYDYENFFSVYKNFITYDNAIIKGKWQKKIIKKYNIKNKSRSIMSSFEQFLHEYKTFQSKIFNLFPNKIRRIVKCDFT